MILPRGNSCWFLSCISPSQGLNDQFDMGRVEGGDQCLGSSEVCGVWTGLHTTQHWAGDQVGSTSPTTARYLQVPVDTKTVSQPQLPTQPSAEFLSSCTEWVSLVGWSHYLGHPELHLFARELLECQAYLWSWWCKTPVMWADNSQGDTGRARCSWSPASLAINTSPPVRHRLSCTILSKPHYFHRLRAFNDHSV